MSEPPLTREEQRVLKLLAESWEAFRELPVQHPAHVHEFAQAIRTAQRLVMVRPTARGTGTQEVGTSRGRIT